MEQVSVRYIVDDVDAAMEFSVRQLGFAVVMHPAPAFAMLTRGALGLLLSAPAGPDAAGGGAGGVGGGQAMPDGTLPAPGGWNRFSLQVDDLGAAVEALRAAGVPFRSDSMPGIGVNQVLIEDPSGNPVELFEPILPEAAQRTVPG
ncbi:VOC family protein [Pseudarthrobacter sp. P1]|uniref:VOC family protein n=1 Tax=Pseudarthrobacter sp. P1 TaxID=3418418 RepID=UPI003CEB6430